MKAPAWSERALLGATIAVSGTFALALAFVSIVVPYRFWDSLAFGSWSRGIAKNGELWNDANTVSITRPLFYVPQGLLWRAVTSDEWIGRLLSATFAIFLVLSVWLVARELTRDDELARLFTPPLAVAILLSSSVFATYAAAGMTDVPVAAMSAATAAVLWSRLRPAALVPLAALGALATMLAKPSGLLALVGLGLGTLALRGRRALLPIAAVISGTALGLAYDAWQAGRYDVSLPTILRAGNDDFWLARGQAVRFDTIVAGAWMGEAARVLVVFGLVNALARVLGAGARIALALAVIGAVFASVAGPLAGDGTLGYPFRHAPFALLAWITLVTALAVASFLARDDPTSRTTYAVLLVWLAPVALTWAWQRPDEARLLAPAWPALALAGACALTSASVALARLRPPAALVPAGLVFLVALGNVVSIDGLGQSGWRQLRDLGPGGWRERGEMENFAYGPFSYELNLARENVAEDERIVSSDGRLQYFFPGQVTVVYARHCGDLAGSRFFSYLTAGESLEFAQLNSQPTDPLGWQQCTSPAVMQVGEQEGIYDAFVVGEPPAEAPSPADCRITSSPGEKLDGVFGRDLSYRAARRLVDRALQVGFAGAHVERTSCARFRVVVTGIPDDERVRREFRDEVASTGLQVQYEDGERFPEVSPTVSPVPP